MPGWRLETAAIVGTVVAMVVGLTSGIDLTIWTAAYAICVYSLLVGLILAKWARIKARAGRMTIAWALTIGAGILLLAGATFTILVLDEPYPVDNNGHDL